MRYLLAVAICLCFSSLVQADFLDYTFVGVLPDGASTHSQVADGEIWTAIMRIDTSAADTNSDPNFGVYEGAVVFGSLEFSGGYVAASTNFSGGTAFALDDVFSADSIRVRGESGISDFVFQVNSEDLSTLNSDSLPGAGTNIDPFPDFATFEYFQIAFDDEFGTIVYFANQANNVSFTVTAVVPEPSSSLLAFTFLVMLTGRRK